MYNEFKKLCRTARVAGRRFSARSFEEPSKEPSGGPSEPALPAHFNADRNPRFVGRVDLLRQMDDALLPENRLRAEDVEEMRQSYTVHGLGGIGKTELAREYALSRCEQFDAVFWVEAETADQLSKGFTKIASHLGYSDQLRNDPVATRQRVLEWLKAPKRRQLAPETGSEETIERNWLLVFNNADDMDLLRMFWPVGQKGAIITTSRDPAARQSGPGTNLGPLDPETAATLLRRLIPVPDSPDTCETSMALATRLDCVPLAISQIAGLIKVFQMNLGRFLVFYDRDPIMRKLIGVKLPRLGDPYEHSLSTVWALEKLPPNALSFLRVLSFLDPGSIQESLISYHLPDRALSRVDQILAQQDLIKRSLFRKSQDGERLEIHALVQDLVRMKMKPDDIARTIAVTACMLTHAYPSKILRYDHDSTSLDASENLLPHVMKLYDFCKEKRAKIESHNAERILTILFVCAGRHLLAQSKFLAAKPLLLAALKPFSTVEKTAAMSHVHADCVLAVSTLLEPNENKIDQSLKYAHTHLELRLMLRNGSQHQEELAGLAYGELAHIQTLAGQSEKAIKNAQTSLHIAENIPSLLAGNDLMGNEWPTFSSVYLASALASLGRYEEAMMPVQRCLEYWESQANDSPCFQLGIIHQCIGALFNQQGFKDRSCKAWLLALEHFRGTVGDGSHYVSQIHSSLGTYHAEKGDLAEARMHIERAIDGYRSHGCHETQLAKATLQRDQIPAAAEKIVGSSNLSDESKSMQPKGGSGDTKDETIPSE